MTIVRRLALAAGALGCVALAVTLALLAIDASRWNEAFDSGDVRFRVAPEDERLWRPVELVRGRAQVTGGAG